eukprot:12044601-Alexandrium_andersonii.AAC.1
MFARPQAPSAASHSRDVALQRHRLRPSVLRPSRGEPRGALPTRVAGQAGWAGHGNGVFVHTRKSAKS